ncbi:MAG: rod shape-determining protein RodA [Thermodesulfobacteriota bacterium]|nr:rod shape-determining protein RodA [Thermodesulfobacteriota bacterium]
MIDHSAQRQFDWGLLLLVLFIGIVGVIVLYSAAASEFDSVQRMLFAKQIIWLGIGLALMVVSLLFNYKSLDGWAMLIYCLNIALLIGVLFWGKEAGGSRRWLPLGPVAIQPSELMKITITIALARYYAKHVSVEGLTPRTLFMPMVLVMIPFALIVGQPDLGTAMLILLIAASMTIFVKIEKRTSFALIGIFVTLVPFVWAFFLKSYQRQRILTFLNPDRDPLGAGYHIIQSKIAIGSGMIFGKGFMKGTQNALAFLPEQHTDFILSVLAEEWGFVGTGVLLLLYLLLIIWGISIAYQCRDAFGIILAVGISAMMFWQVFINVGMVMGLMPVVGVPLPLISYGGSSVVTFMLGVGILINISIKRLGI